MNDETYANTAIEQCTYRDIKYGKKSTMQASKYIKREGVKLFYFYFYYYIYSLTLTLTFLRPVHTWHSAYNPFFNYNMNVSNIETGEDDDDESFDIQKQQLVRRVA